MAGLPACTLALTAWLTHSAQAAGCSAYEVAVFNLADEARTFQHSASFRELGWSKAGPSGGWLMRFEATRAAADRVTALNFWQTYGFSLTDVYQVANQLRTVGQLDAFYQNIETAIQRAERCTLP